MSSKNEISTSGEVTNSAPDGPAVVPDDAPARSGNRIGRRTFVKGLGASAAGAVALGLDDGPVGDAQAIAPLLAVGAIGLAAGAVGGVAFGRTFLGPDSSEVSDSLDWQAHVDEFTRAREDEMSINQTMASLKRDIQLVENKAREDAIFRIYEQGVDSGTQSGATAAAEAAINETYATVQKSLYRSFELRFMRATNIYAGFLSQYDTNQIPLMPGLLTVRPDGSEVTGDIDWSYSDMAWARGTDLQTDKSITLYDGTSLTYSAGVSNGFRNGHYSLTDPHPANVDDTALDTSARSGIIVNKPDPADYSSRSDPLDVSYESALVVNVADWYELLVDLDDAHTAMMSEVSSMVSAYFQPAVDGEIDLMDAASPSHLTDTASTAQDYQEATMALRAMGYPISKQVVTIEVPTDDGSGIELTGRLAWTAHNGNSLAVGQTLSPSNISGSVFAAVNLPEGVGSLDGNTTNTTDGDSTDTGPGAEIVELTGGFTILSAEGAESVTFEDRTLASSDLTNDQINQIFKENFEANEEATANVHDTATGGGGGATWSNLSGLEKGGLFAIAAAVVGGLLK